jgi:hypothetical protein
MDIDFDVIENRATCSMGMARCRNRFLVHLAPADAQGIEPELRLHIATRAGAAYDLFFTYSDGAYGEISSEPSEPDALERGIRHARSLPIVAAVELLQGALSMPRRS